MPHFHRHQPDSADRPLQPHLPPQRAGEQPHHRRPGQEPAHEDRHQPVPTVSGRQRPDGVPSLHPLHPYPQPHEGLHLRQRYMQAGDVFHGYVSSTILHINRQPKLFIVVIVKT